MKLYDSSYRPPNDYEFDNKGLPWTPTQYKHLATYYEQGASLKDICIALQRPPSGVLAKLAQLRLVSYDQLTNKYHVNERKVIESEAPMNEERVDWITTQYVWAIDSDSKYYELLKAAVEEKNFIKFRRACGSAIDDIRSCLIAAGEDSTFTENDRAFVVLTLWASRAGPELHGDPNFSSYYTVLRKSGVSYPGTQITEIINPTETVTQEVNIMANKLFESKQFIGGIETTQLSEAQLITVIKNTEDEIAKLRQIKTTSKKITANIEAMEADLASVVAVLDAR